MVSVIIPLYNKSETILNTVDSVFNQTNKSFELIIVDDGSTDDSLNKLSSITTNTNVKIISQPNKGVSAARNLGVSHAQFPYVAFLDADDSWENDFLETAIHVIRNNENVTFVSSGGRILHKNKVNLRVDNSKQLGEVFNPNVFKNPYTYIHTSSVVIKKDTFNEVGKFPESLRTNEDLACFFRIVLKNKLFFINRALSNYSRDVDGQLSKVTFNKMPVCFVQRVNYVHEFYLENKLTNHDYLKFTSYEILDRYYKSVTSKDFESVNFLNAELSPKLIDELCFPLRKIISIKNKFFFKLILSTYKLKFFMTK